MRYLNVPARPPAVVEGHLRMGEPPGCPDAIAVNSRYLTRGGQPWFPLMGEFHFSRYPAAQWREELVKMRGGGITVVATYIFWIMHEERRGTFDFTGDRDLRAFVRTCAEVGLDVVVRIGPWAHGECRNGGFPDWLLTTGCSPRSDDPGYLALVRPLFAQLAAQLRGLARAAGGPIVGIQLENELYAAPDHLLTLKRMAREAGLEAPLWTATGWGHARLPADDVLPVFGGYSEAAWDTAHDGWPRQSRAHYFFGPGRDDDSIGADLRIREQGGHAAVSDESHLDRYPFATCELGGGMYTSYHRRPIIDPDDVAALALVKIGSGSVWQGYYLYHGASMKIGALSTLQESHATGYPNDCPVITYDFQAPLGEYGQFRESFARLRTQHLWLADHGPDLARMALVMPDGAPVDTAEKETLRWAVRSDGDAGYLFVNNHQPVESLPDHDGVRFTVRLAGRDLTLPARPVTVPSGAYFVWPLARPIAGAARLTGSAQPLCELTAAGVPTTVLTQTAAIDVGLALHGVDAVTGPGTVRREGDLIWVTDLRPGTDCRLRLTDRDGETAEILVLDEKSAHSATRGHLWGADRLVLCSRPAVVDDGRLIVYGAEPGDEVLVFPPALPNPDETDRIFSRHPISPGGTGPAPGSPTPVGWRLTRPAGQAKPAVVDATSGRASAPPDADFDTIAAVVRVEIPADALDHDDEVLLRIDWVGDVGRAYLDGQLVADHFWYGEVWEIGLRRFHPAVLADGLELRLLPLRQDAPIYLSPRARPTTYHDGQTLDVRSISVAPVRRTVLTAPVPAAPNSAEI